MLYCRERRKKKLFQTLKIIMVFHHHRSTAYNIFSFLNEKSDFNTVNTAYKKNHFICDLYVNVGKLLNSPTLAV